MTVVGSSGRLYIVWGDTPDDDRPVEGDFLRSHPAGSCYRIDEVRPGRSPARVNYRVTRLGRDAVAADAEGVFLFSWLKR